MSNNQASTILSIQVEGFESVEKMKLELKALKQARTDLDNQNKTGTLAEKEYTQAIGANAAAQAGLTSQIKAQTVALKANDAEIQHADGSIDHMKVQLSKLTKEWNALSEAERVAAKGMKIQADAANLSTRLKALEGSVGNFTRSVGGYAKGIESAFGGKLQNVLGEASKSLGALGSAGAGAGNALQAFGTGLAGGPLVLALSTLPILINGVVKAFGSMDDAFLYVEANFEAFKVNATNTFIDVRHGWEDFVKSVKTTWQGGDNAFTREAKAFEEMQDRVSAGLGTLEEEQKVYSNAIIAENERAVLGQKMSQEELEKAILESNKRIEADYKKRAISTSKIAYDAVVNIDNTEDAIRQLRGKEVGYQKEIDQQMLISQDRVLKYDERLAAANKAKEKDLEITRQIGEQQQILITQQTKLLMARAGQDAFSPLDPLFKKAVFTGKELADVQARLNELANPPKSASNPSGKSTLVINQKEADEQLIAAQKQLADIENLQRDKDLKYNQLTSRIRKGEIAEQRQAAEKAAEERKKQAAKEIEDTRTVLRLRVEIAQTADEEFKAKKQQLDFELNQSKKATPANADLLQAKYNKDVAALDKALYDRKEKEAVDAEKKKADAVEKVYNQELSDLERHYIEENNAIKQGELAGVLTMQQAQSKELELQKAHFEALIKLEKKYSKDTLQVETQLLDAQIANNQKQIQADQQTEQARAQIQKAQIDASKRTFGVLVQINDSLNRNSTESLEFKKDIAVAQSAIALGESIAESLRIAGESSLDPISFTASIAEMVATAVSTIVSANSAIQGAKAPTPPNLKQYGNGGYVYGASHSEGGVNANLEGGEFVMSRPAVKMFGQQIAAMHAIASGQAVSSSAITASNRANAIHVQTQSYIQGISNTPKTVLSTYQLARTYNQLTINSQLARV